MKLLLTGARVIDPSQKIDADMDVLLENGKIAKIAPDLLKSVKSKDSERARVTASPPALIERVNTMSPFRKIARSVVCPPNERIIMF